MSFYLANPHVSCKRDGEDGPNVRYSKRDYIVIETKGMATGTAGKEATLLSHWWMSKREGRVHREAAEAKKVGRSGKGV